MKKNLAVLVSAPFVAGAALVVLSWTLNAQETWLSDLFLNVGVTLLLFLGLFLLERRLERRLAEGESETRKEIQRVDRKVSDLAGRINRAVKERIDEQGESIRRDLDPLKEEPTAEMVATAVQTAQHDGLVASSGPRVRLPGTPYSVRFVVYPAESPLGRLWLQIEEPTGRFVTDWEWTSDLSVNQAGIDLTAAVSAADQELRPQDVRPGELFEELHRLLLTVRQRSIGPGRVRRVVQLFGAQWALTEDGIQSLDPEHLKAIAPEDLDSDATSSLAAEPWVDQGALADALTAARSMTSPLGSPTYPGAHLPPALFRSRL